MARNQLNQQQQGFPPGQQQQQQGYPGQQQQQQGYPGQQQAGPQQPTGGWNAEPVAHGGPTPGWAAQPTPRSGPLPGGRRRGGDSIADSFGDNPLDALGEGVAGLAMGAAAKFIGRRIGQRVQQTIQDQVLPNIAAKRDEMLRTQISIADRHPDLRACLADKVVFLAGGNRFLPMPNLAGPLTVEQADQLVAQLRNG